jgi:hypothetical protein
MTAEAVDRVSPLSPCGRGVGGEGLARKRLFIARLTARTPHPAHIARSEERAFFRTPYVATFPRKGGRGAAA